MDKLREKYWKGETSVDEERLLKLSAKADDKNADDMFFKTLGQMKSNKKEIHFEIPKSKKRYLWSFTSIAASIIIIIGLAIGFNNNSKSDPYEIDDPELAYNITKEALMMVSGELNKGKNYSSRIDKINEVKTVLINN